MSFVSNFMAAQLGQIYVFEKFQLEPDTRRLSQDRQAIHLTKKPFNVLVYLIENRGRMVTRRELLDAFWDGHDVYEETLTKCVGAIRKALGDNPENPRLIETFWAEGYRFIGEVNDRYAPAESISVVERTRAVTITVEDELESNDNVLPGPPRHAAARYFAGVGLLVLICALAGVLLYRSSNIGAETVRPPRSLAVLPLKNLTGDAGNDYLCDGVTENLINSLSKIDNLKVIARGSSFIFKDKGIEPVDAGNAFGVEAVLTGTVQKEGEILRAAVRLVETKSGRVIWASEIKRSAQDIFALQAEVARSVAANLQPSATLASRIPNPPTANAEAYKLYLKGRYFWHLYTEDSLNRSIEYFDQASVEDPNFVLAYCGLSDAYNALGFNYRPPVEVMPKAGFFASKALSLDENSADAHYSMAAFRFWYERDWSGAESALKRALEIDPNHTLAHNLYGDYLVALGRDDEGLAEVARAVEIDPLAHFSNCDLAWQYYNAGQNEKSIAHARSNLELVNYCPFDHLYIGQSLGQQGKYAESVAELDKAQNIVKDWSPALAEQGYAYAKSGQIGNAKKILGSLTAASREKYVDPFGLAIINLGLGDNDPAFDALDEAFRLRSPSLSFLNVDSKFDSIRAHPRFADIIRRLGLPARSH